MKITLGFDGHRYGWSEQYWAETPNENPVAFLGSSIINNLRDYRQQFLASGYTLSTVRCQMVRNNGGQTVRRIGDLDEPNRPGNPEWSPAGPKTAILAKHRTASGLSRAVFMRGLNSSLDSGGNAVTFEPAVLSAWNTFVEYLIAQQFGWMHQTILDDAVINSYVADPDTGIVTLTLDAALVPARPRYTVSIDMPTRSPLDGARVIIPTAVPTEYRLAKPVGVRPFDGVKGALTLYQYTFVHVGNNGAGQTGTVKPQRITSRTPGRPLYASRGRQATTVRW